MLARFIRNHRLGDACYRWAFCSVTAPPGARAFYDAHRAKGDTHDQALRVVCNRLVGMLDGSLRHHTLYDQNIAWGHRSPARQEPARNDRSLASSKEVLDIFRLWDVLTALS